MKPSTGIKLGGDPLIQYSNCILQEKCSRNPKVEKSHSGQEDPERCLTRRHSECFHMFIPSDPVFHNFQKCIQRKQSDADTRVCKGEFTAALFIRKEGWKQPKRLEYVNKRDQFVETGRLWTERDHRIM